MPNSYLTGSVENPNVTPQSQKIPGREAEMEKSKSGGVLFVTDIWSALQRFLILGTEGGTYYAGQREHTTKAVATVAKCIKEDGLRTVRVITEVSQAGRAPKNDPAILALAMASIQGDEATRRAALDALPLVCRIGTHLFQFAELREALGGGWGRGVQRAVGEWYTEPHFPHKMLNGDTVLAPGDAGHQGEALGYQLIKYQQRGGWSHRDLLRLAKPVGDEAEPGVQAALRWAVGKPIDDELRDVLPQMIWAFELAKQAGTPQRTADLIRQYNLPREALKTEHLNDNVVWEAMLDQGMPMTALVRNLATMTRNGLLTATSNYTKTITDQLGNADAIRKSRIHPVQLYMALKTYAAGHGQRSRGEGWVPVPAIVDALDDAFYTAFENVEATGKRRLVALDISGSMWGGNVAGIPGFTPAEAAGVMAMVTVKTGDPYEVVCFTAGNLGAMYGRRYSERAPANELIPGLSPMALSKKQRLDDVGHAMERMSRYMGGTDASLPVEYAIEKSREFDVFEVYTDNESWAGKRHASQALKDYRKRSGINAKLVAVAFTATNYSIADPKDPGMMDVVGFDTAAPQLIQAFVDGQV